MPRGKKKCPECNKLNGVRSFVCECGYVYPKSGDEKPDNGEVLSKHWEKPDIRPAIGPKPKDPLAVQARKYDMRLASMIEEGIMTIDAEKLVACRKSMIKRIDGVLYLLVDIFNERKECE